MTAQHGGQTPGAEVAQRTFVSDEEQTAAMPPPGGAEEQSAETAGKTGESRPEEAAADALVLPSSQQPAQEEASVEAQVGSIFEELITNSVETW
jgi:hypothetical protein